MIQASQFLSIGFIVLALLCAGLFVWAVAESAKRAGVTAGRRIAQIRNASAAAVIWMALTYGLADAGLLAFGPMPPRLPIVINIGFVLVFLTAFSRLGAQLIKLPFRWLIGFQSFRIFVELLLHRAYVEGVMPVQMSFEGYNFDILSGITALLLMLAAGRRPLGRRLILAWNFLGLVLLLTIIGIAVVSMPIEGIRLFNSEPANTWVTHAPFVWLPTVMVYMALLGHVLVFRKLRAERAAE